MIDVKQAVRAAFEFFRSLYGPDEFIDLALEEVELADNEKSWLVTLGFTRLLTEPLSEMVSQTSRNLLGLPSSLQLEQSEKYAIREYKLIQVRADTGEAKSMKIRKI